MKMRDKPTTVEIANEAFKQAKEHGVKIVMINGGEPLSSDMLLPVLSIADSYGLTTEISTNGDLITEEILREITNRGCHRIVISVPTMEDFYRMIPKFKLVEKFNMFLAVSSVYTNENKGYFLSMFEEMADFSSIKKLVKISLYPHPSHVAQIPSDEESDKIAIELYKFQLSHPDKHVTLLKRPMDYFVLKPYIPDLPFVTCGNDWEGGVVRVLPDGDIINCVFISKVIGNVMTHNIKKIGQNPDMRRHSIIEHCPHYRIIKEKYPELLEGRKNGN